MQHAVVVPGMHWNAVLPQVLKKGTLIVTVTVTVTVVAAVVVTVTVKVAETCRRAVFVHKGVSRTNL